MNLNSNDVPLPIANVGFSGAIQNRTRWDDNISWFNIPDKIPIVLRFFGPVSVYYYHWFKTKTGKKFPSICAGYDQATQTFVKGRCPYEDDFNVPQIVEDAKRSNHLFDEENDPLLKEIKMAKCAAIGFGHVLLRNSYQMADRSVAGRSWQPIRIPRTVLFQLLKLKSMNLTTPINGKQYEADIADPYWGRDIQILYNSQDRNPNARYTINMGERTPLTDVEKSYVNQLYQWSNLVEYPSYDEMKQQLYVNGYYQMMNQIRGVLNFDSKPQQHAHMEQYLTPVPKSPYGDPYPVHNVKSYPTQNQNVSMATNSYGVPQQQNLYQQVPYQQVPMPQGSIPSAPLPSNMVGMSSMPNMGLTEANTPVASPIPQNVPPPLGMNNEEYDIPFNKGDVAEQHFSTMPASPVPEQKEISHVFDVEENPNGTMPISNGSAKTYSVRGRPSGVTPAEFQKIIQDFGNNLPRAKPFKPTDDPQLEGLNVLACFGNYCGDLNCVKCPLRQYCLHA